MSQEVLQIARESMRDNRKLLAALGKEKPVILSHTPKEQSIISALLDMLPKSTEGKLALAGLVALVAWDLLRKNRE